MMYTLYPKSIEPTALRGREARTKRGARWFGAAVLGGLIAITSAVATDDSIITSIYSKVSNGYVRQKTPDGKIKREYYALAKGTYVPGLVKDRSIDEVAFPAIAGTVGPFLAKQEYFMAENSKSANLLLT